MDSSQGTLLKLSSLHESKYRDLNTRFLSKDAVSVLGRPQNINHSNSNLALKARVNTESERGSLMHQGIYKAPSFTEYK